MYRRITLITLPETNSKFAPKTIAFPFGAKGLFSGAFAVSSREGMYITLHNMETLKDMAVKLSHGKVLWRPVMTCLSGRPV